MSLAGKLALSTLKFVVLVAVVLFASAGTIHFWQAWAYLALNAAGMTITNRYLTHTDPALGARRLLLDERGETDRVQRRVMTANRLIGLAMLVCAGLDRRFAWSHVPIAVVAVACASFACGTAIIYASFRANTFASSVIEIDAQQTVTSSGPYAIVRHPMYSGALLMGLRVAARARLVRRRAFTLPIAFLVLVVRLTNEESNCSRRVSKVTPRICEKRAGVSSPAFGEHHSRSQMASCMLVQSSSPHVPSASKRTHIPLPSGSPGFQFE